MDTPSGSAFERDSKALNDGRPAGGNVVLVDAADARNDADDRKPDVGAGASEAVGRITPAANAWANVFVVLTKPSGVPVSDVEDAAVAVALEFAAEDRRVSSRTASAPSRGTAGG